MQRGLPQRPGIATVGIAFGGIAFVGIAFVGITGSRRRATMSLTRLARSQRMLFPMHVVYPFCASPARARGMPHHARYRHRTMAISTHIGR